MKETKFFGLTPKEFSDLMQNADGKNLQIPHLSLITPVYCPLPTMPFPENDNYSIYSKRDLSSYVDPRLSFRDAHSLLCERDRLAFLNPNRSLPFLRYLGQKLYPRAINLEVDGM